MTEIIRKIAPRYNSIIVSALSFLVVGVFMYVGYAIFNNGKDLAMPQVELLKDYLWWLGLGFVLVMLNWFGAAVPFLKDIIGSLVALRTGRQDATTQMQQPLPTHNQFSYPTMNANNGYTGVNATPQATVGINQKPPTA